MKRKIDTIIENEENVEKLSIEIINTFTEKANKSNVDYSFDITKGTGKIKSRNPNTTFFFDTDKNTLLDKMKKALFDEDLSDIKEGNKEEEFMNKVNDFLEKVGNKITLDYHPLLEDTIRRVILPGSVSEVIPLEEISIISIEIADFSSVPEPAKHMLKVGKKPDGNVKTDKITTFIHDKQEETGQTIEEIFNEEKLINPLFKDIISIEQGDKYLYDVNIVLFIDYSLSKLPPEELARNQLKVKK